MDNDHSWNTVFCEHCGHTLSVPVYCKNRFCSVCSNHRNRLIRHKISTVIGMVQLRKFDSFKFLTLTIKNQPDIQAMTTELIKSFRKLRQRALWRMIVRGGFTVIEVKPGKDGWHVHLHVIIESGYLPFELLLAEWQVVSTGSGVYIKKLHGSQVIGYITKYLTAEKSTILEQKDITVHLQGRRLFQPFGSWFAMVNAIKRMTFPCPACNSVHWFFGNHDQWFRSSLPQSILDNDTYERAPPNSSAKQTSLIPELGHSTTIHD